MYLSIKSTNSSNAACEVRIGLSREDILNSLISLQSLIVEKLFKINRKCEKIACIAAGASECFRTSSSGFYKGEKVRSGERCEAENANDSCDDG